MSEEWPEFVRTIFNAEILIHQKYATRNLDRVTLESMESVIAELHFLYIFVGYSHKWSDAASSSSSSSSHNTKMEPLFIKVATAAKEFTIYLQHAFIDRFTHEGFTTSELLHVFNSLDQKVALLKPEIREAYQVSLSTQSFHPQPPSSRTSNSSWNCFCLSLESNLQYLSEEKSLFLGNPLRKQMKVWEQSLRSLYWLLRSDHHIHDWSPWRDIIMAHLGGIVLQVAHLCCLCWYNAPVDQSTEKDMAINLSDLYQKMNSTTPDFLENTLGYLQQYVGEHIRVLKDERGIIQKELVTLIIGLTRIPKIHDVDVQRILVGIKDALLEARYLKDRDRGENKIYFAILFAKIWWLKAEIFFQSSDTLTLSLDDHVRALHEGYEFLKELFSPTDEKSVEYQIWKLIAQVPKQVESVYQSSDVKDYLVHVKVNHLLLKSLVHIMLLKAESFFLELLQKDASLLLPLKHKIRTIHKGLLYMIEVVISKAEENMEDEKLILQDIEVMATRLISLSNAFPVDNLTEAVVKNVDVWLLDLLEEDKHLKAKLKKFYLHTPMLNLPKTPGLCLIENVLQNFRDVLNHKHDLGAYVIHLIEAICEDLKFIISAFRDVFEQGFDIQELQNLHTRLIEAAYLAEYTMDLMVLENDAKRQQLVEVYHLSDEIKHIKLQIDNFCSNNTYGHGIHNNNVPQKLMPFVSQVNTTSTEEVMVGINDQKEAVIGRLTRGTLQRALVSIVGMPGIGKTTLANNVFCSPKVMYHFPIRAWCCVSQKYKKRDLLLDILSNIITITDDTHSMSDTDLDSLLYKQLKRKMYLIIMDDMWSTEAWDELQLSFSDDSNGSRILLTSRLQDVVSKISDPFLLRPLSVEESWELLKIKIFREEECPQELWEIGQKIAENCKGLPLAIGAIAGLLDRTNKNQDLWKQIAKSVSSSVVNDPETQCKEILELSYKHLPDHLKACFLYFGVFPEDKDIPV